MKQEMNNTINQAWRRPRMLAILAVFLTLAVGIWLLRSTSGPGQPDIQEPSRLSALVLPRASDGPHAGLRLEVRQILGQGAPLAPQSRLDLLRASSTELRDTERLALLGEMSQPRQDEVDAGWYAEYFHELALALGRQDALKDEFARVLLAVASDGNRDGVVRDYAVQHLRSAWERSDGNPALQRQIVHSLRHLVSEEPEVSGAALLVLHLLGSRPDERGAKPAPAVQTAELEALVRSTLLQSQTPDLTPVVMGALRIVAERRMQALAPEVRMLVEDGSRHTLVRMRAIAALADLGQKGDRDFLSSLDGSDPRINAALASALDRLP